MTTPRRDQGRAATAARLIAALATKLSPGHPARIELRELQKLYGGNLERLPGIRELIEQVPGKSLTKKAARIGISKGTLWAIWHGKYTPTTMVMTAIERAAGDEQ